MYKIGELASRTGCSVQAIRYYEKEQLLPSTQRSQGNFRLYNRSALDKVLFIKQCRSLDLSIAEIRHLIELNNSRDMGCNNVSELVDSHIAQVELRMRDLEELRRKLLTLRVSCTDDRTIEKCGILRSLSTAQQEND
ncbi:Cd(II)/Pb(II)-responsive transcriptional regulator [Halieaceae bacterium IMCC14734]|uniref:Cd(II)/Pb(II)-responsive transcriptional regulator n=1 Tax=Candidatus Litorirhabdus singularis TaxID=2518993 RepID=A0ABT3TK76_9GAMM|nr:Cd(II)/Pb(II)-responsive transcriptional regulator [Candidatus Litorirhabdus singularis]MCX2982683.1 Cd(II)/Pb(II)-responsive transcriptional regulator [Candidatus Litorirhabdus singularis]